MAVINSLRAVVYQMEELINRGDTGKAARRSRRERVSQKFGRSRYL